MHPSLWNVTAGANCGGWIRNRFVGACSPTEERAGGTNMTKMAEWVAVTDEVVIVAQMPLEATTVINPPPLPSFQELPPYQTFPKALM